MVKAKIFEKENGEYVKSIEKDHIKVEVDGLVYVLDMGCGQIRIRSLNGGISVSPKASNSVLIKTTDPMKSY
jgi:hypothetical protein